MLTASLPDTLATLLTAFTPCFRAPTFQTFKALAAGFLAQPGPRTVTGMLTGARLAGRRTTTSPTGSLRPPAGAPTRSG